MFEINVEDPAGTIVAACEAAGLKPSHLAEKIGVSPSTLTKAKSADKLSKKLVEKLTALRDELGAAPQPTTTEATTPAVTEIKFTIKTLQDDDQIQQRVTHLDPETVDRYVEAVKEDWTLPPIVVFRDADNKHWLADGLHRVAAAKREALADIPAEVRQGSRDDALLYAVGANAEHGLPRTNKDKRRAVTTMLQHPEFGSWSNHRIAEACKVSPPFVGTVRAELEKEKPLEAVPREIVEPAEPDEPAPKVEHAPAPIAPPPQPRKSRDGRTVDTAGISKANKARKGPVTPAKEAEQAIHRFTGACADLRKVKIGSGSTFNVAALARDTLIWCLPSLKSTEVQLILDKITSAVKEGCGNA